MTMAASLSSHRSIFLILWIVILCGHAHARFFSRDPLSDGVSANTWEGLLRLPSAITAESSCEQTYGFLPCTTTVIGNLFLIIVYGFLMFKAATFLSGGSELLLEILGPGIVGGLFLPILGALPDAMLILGSKETAQSQVSVGMGLLAGSTVLLLTIIWGTCVIVGKCDIENSIAIDSRDTRGFNLTGSGVSTDIWTSYAARIMVISVLPFLIVQLPQILNSTSGRHLAVLIALIVSLCLLAAYCLYQKRALGRLLKDNGEPDKEVIEKLFRTIDEDQDGSLTHSELKALVVGIQFEEIDLDHDDAVKRIMNDFDTSGNELVDEVEFVNGVSRWLQRAQRARVASGDAGPHTMKFLSDFHTETKREHDLLDVGDQSNEEAEGIENAKWTSIKAVLLLLLGTIIAAAFADPLVDVVDNFSEATSIPAFFISFIALPLATNSSEAVSAIIFASRDKRQTASLTFSELYGAVTMNNVLCLSVFLALVYARGLTWDFSSEVLVILVVCLVVGVFASFRTVFPLWTSILAILLYPFSLALVYVLDYVFGWS
ncbi:Sodium/calcium exchanger [Vigna angularis]|uniref:Sodium/calcium exchanger n=1 Tax=Phaseolus angularis TaxID=3914 RepID=A0A8T0JFS1_PHAAN|nr:Sodium/calcium exchanger [Vigna angularis]